MEPPKPRTPDGFLLHSVHARTDGLCTVIRMHALEAFGRVLHVVSNPQKKSVTLSSEASVEYGFRVDLKISKVKNYCQCRAT